MKFTFDWLKDHIRTNLSYQEISDKLTSLGIEVDEIIDNSKKFDKFVVGFIKKADKHPNADKLQICEVDVGTKTLQIVCGAKNARPGIYVAVALVGALVPAFNENLKKGHIRGVDSYGMMCSTDELLLDDDGIDGIMELAGNVKPGQSLSEALDVNDIIFDVSITPNRADCFSVRGIARDLAAAGAGDLLDLPECNVHENIENPVDVEVKTQHCSYFSTLAIRDVAGSTPKYIEKRLKAIGQKLIQLPVDVANYICIDIGQPLHIFDLDKLHKKLYVREALSGEMLQTLDGKLTKLPEGAVVVSTKDAPLSIAGIMGGESSAFSDESKNILIESAYFDKISISKTGQAIRLTSDSRIRFERGVDPLNVDFAIRYASSIIMKSCNGKTSNVKKYGELPSNKNIVTLSFAKFHHMTNLQETDFLRSGKILEKLGLKVQTINKESLVVETPSWRHDLMIPEDIIEELIRVIGYENILEMDLPYAEPITRTYNVDKMSDALSFNGYQEVKTFSFIDSKTAGLFSCDENILRLVESCSAELSCLRPSVIASHLKSLVNAQNKSQKNLKIFEVGRRFFKDGKKINEENTLTATISEKMVGRNWLAEQKDVSVFDIKAILEKILNMVVANYRIQSGALPYYHPGRSGTYVFQKDIPIAYFGELHPSVLSEVGLDGPVVCFELLLDRIPEVAGSKVKAPITLSQFQPTNRDFSFIVKKTVSAAEIINAVKRLRIETVKNISVFDIYEADSIGKDNKAIAIEVMMQSDKSTLSLDQISYASKMIIDGIAKNCGGTLREQ